MLNSNILYIIPSILKGRRYLSKNEIKNAYIQDIGTHTFLYLKVHTNNFEHRHKLYKKLTEQNNFYGFFDNAYTFVLSKMDAVFAKSIITIGIQMLPENQLERYFSFWKE